MPKPSRRTARWSWTTGDKGSNRVRVSTHPKSNLLVLTWYEPVVGGRPRARTRGLGHADRVAAKQAAEALASTLRQHGPMAVSSGTLTIGMLFEMFEAAMQQVGRLRSAHVSARKRFVACFGAHAAVAGLDEHAVERYSFARSQGRIRMNGKLLPPVRARAIEEELTILRTVLRWAVRKRTATGAKLLGAMPIDTWHIPKEENVRRPMLAHGEYEAMLAKAWAVDPRLWLAMVLCHETGHRLNSVRHLRWSDVDVAALEVTWRGEHQKNGSTHVTPLTPAAAEALGRYQRHTGGIGVAWIFPGRAAGEPLRRDQFSMWWRAVRDACELPRLDRSGFHCLRRKMASELATAPLAMVAALGGWKNPHVVVAVYQRPTMQQQRDVLLKRGDYAVGRG